MEMIDLRSGIERDETLICPGTSNVLRLMSRIAPSLVLNRFSKTVDRMFPQPVTPQTIGR